MKRSLSATVVICIGARERLVLLQECVDSVLHGDRVPEEVLVVVDQNPPLAAELRDVLPALVGVLETEGQGLSEARNVGIRAGSSDIVAFVDDDATVAPDWLSSMMAVFERQDDVLGVGGLAQPRWGADRRWLGDELLWVVGCTYRGHRPDAGPIRNPIGCNMAFRRSELIALGAFATGFGKRGNALETCDETELALRLESVRGPGRILYVPEARIRHFVPGSRISWRLLVRRSLSEGLSKGRLYRLYRRGALAAEGAYFRQLVTGVVPHLIVGGIWTRDARLIRRAAAIVASLCITGTAFLVGAARAGRTGTPAISNFPQDEQVPAAAQGHAPRDQRDAISSS
jgi:glycosyltransferase involved in cell wall biosynthesis